MEVAVENLQSRIALNLSRITRITKTILRHEKVRRAELGVVFVSSQKIKALNKKFLHRDYATDVLAFDLREGGISRDSKARRGELRGEIIISVDTAAYNAGIYRTSLEREIILYVIHGILHLLGYDDHRPQDIQRMREKERQILEYAAPLITRVLSRAQP